MESQSVQEVALSNPIVNKPEKTFQTAQIFTKIDPLFQILTQILKQSSAPLRSCRLVSHFWNEIVLHLPNTRLALNLDYKIYEENNALPFFAMCSPSDDRLAKRVSATCPTVIKCTPSHSINPFTYRIMHICDKFSDRVQILDIFIEFEDCLQVIFQILKNYCPNLKQVHIVHFRDEYESDIDAEILPAPLQIKPNLTWFTVYCVKNVTPSLTTLIQLVMDASPNLKKVRIPWGFYPDLGNSKCLDNLAITLNEVRPMVVALTEFNLPELSRMLGQVGDQLVTLQFEHADIEGVSNRLDFKNSLPTARFRLPRNMSKLVSFQNDMIDIFQRGISFKTSKDSRLSSTSQLEQYFWDRDVSKKL